VKQGKKKMQKLGVGDQNKNILHCKKKKKNSTNKMGHESKEI